MNFLNFWDVALISTIKLSICNYPFVIMEKVKKISVLIWHLVHDVDCS